MKDYDRTYVRVDLEAIRHNIKEAKRKIKPGTKIMAIVKADAYGHGAVPVADALRDLVDAYGVAVIEEALELRKHGFGQMILILGYTPKSRYEELVLHDISQTVYTLSMAEELNETAKRLDKKAGVHIKLDTGMGRLGFLPTEDSAEKVARISSLSHIAIEGMFSHFARADETSLEPAKEQLERYRYFLQLLEQRGITIPVKHIANSASIMRFPEAHLDMVRSGITTYGLYPSEEVEKEAMDLRPAMEWKSVISYLKGVEGGTPISYGGTYVAPDKRMIATVPIGYADGLKRDLSNKGRVLIRGKYAPIVGRICMDQFMVDVTEIKEAREGDTVTIFGRDGKNSISVEEISGLSHSFNYEYVCGITKRVPRQYVFGGEKE